MPTPSESPSELLFHGHTRAPRRFFSATEFWKNETDARFRSWTWISRNRHNRAKPNRRATLEPGESSSEKPSVHPESDQTLIVLEGELTAVIAEEKAVMKEGDAVLVPAQTPHRFTNSGRTRATTFSVYAKPAFPPGKKSR